MGTSNRFTKDPDALLDYQVDWSAWLVDGDTIASSTWEVQSGLTLETDASSTTTATAWLSGGTAGATYRVTNRITTAAGLTDDRTLFIQVDET